jgi:4-amino-4-deoxy-L-arabinose transferase-like glycosyltransferase
MRLALQRALPALAACLVLGIYLQTLYPGLVSTGDSPKFQFVGRIWGTPHHPGYPLYVTISHGFSLLPIGTLAYRINVMSAVFAALTVWLIALAVRRLTGSTAAGCGAALALGFGRVFWSQATIAEVYTLAAALLAAALWFLLRWADDRRPRDLLLAVAVVALALGNHLTIAMMAPAFVLFVLATDWRAALRPKVLVAGTAILLAGLAQYGLIISWTGRGPAYLESSARTLGELAAVMRGSQFADRLRAFTPAELVERNGALLEILAAELRPWGIALAAAGLALLIRRRWRVAALLAAASLTVWTFVLHYEIDDPQVFLIPVFLMAAVAAGAALGAAVRAAAGRRPVWRAGAAVLAIAPAAALLAANYRASDHHRRTYEIRLFDAIFRALPDRSVIVPGSFGNRLMLTYKLEGERAAAGREVRLSEPDVAALRALRRDGYRVFAFVETREALQRAGAVLEPVPLWDEPLPRLLGAIAPGRVVAIAGVGIGAALGGRGEAVFPQIGGRASRRDRIGDEYAIVGVTGARDGALESAGPGAAARLDARRSIGPLAAGVPATIEARSDTGGRIAVDGRVIVNAPAAVAIAEIAADGTVLRATVADPAHELRVAFAGDPPLFEVVELRECRDVGNLGWQDTTSMAAAGRLEVRIDNYRPFDSRVLFVVASDGPVTPTIVSSEGPGTPKVGVRAASDEALNELGFAPSGALANLRAAIVEIRVNDQGQNQTMALDFGGPVRAVFASVTVDLQNPRRATLCSGR